MKKILLLIAFTCFSYLVNAQLVFIPLYRNYAIKEYIKNNPSDTHNPKRAINDTLSLPFVDDFSLTNVYPNKAFWLDRFVYINNTYSNSLYDTVGQNAPSINVATFDGFDATGTPYSENAGAYGSCDTLTSKPIDLTPTNPNDPAADSVYLSFYMQPKGTGLQQEPEIEDSLILEFKSPDFDAWIPIRKFKGYTSNEAKKGKRFSFKLQMIPIHETIFLKKGFQFRFRNKGSMYGSDDIWNIDYVKLNRGRTYTDTLLPDASFNANPSSFLKSYTAMPYNQFDPPSIFADNHFVAIRNNFDISKSISLTWTAYNVTHGEVFIDSFKRDIPLARLKTSYEASEKLDFPALGEPSVIRTRYYINTSNDINLFNDTLDLLTEFKDYFAYDDGSAEGGIGLSTTGDGRLAIRFELTEPDTITGVRFFFNRSLTDVSNNLFTLTIWKSVTLGSEAQDIIYQKTTLSPEYDTVINGFVEYNLDSIVVLPAGEFYVGWVQNTPYDINVGFDVNTDNGSKLYFNVTAAGWQQANIYGAPMIRPVFQSAGGNTGVDRDTRDQSVLRVFPNPASNFINITYLNYESLTPSYTIDVVNMIGQVIVTDYNSPKQLDISTLQKGIYFVRLSDTRTNQSFVTKLIKAD